MKKKEEKEEKIVTIVKIVAALIELTLAILIFVKVDKAINTDVNPICECKVDKGVASCLCKKE